jgi:hypothetical protein
LGEKTELYLKVFARDIDEKNRITFYAERQKLATLRLTWFEIHRLIRPAVDAHSLNIPHPLFLSLLRRFGSVPNVRGNQFLILHTDTVNYFEAHATVRGLCDQLRKIIPDAPPFPGNMGVIEFPYSQAESVFLNCLIAHEMGHFFFQEIKQHQDNVEPDFRTTYDEILADIGANLKQTFGSSFRSMKETDLQWCIDRLLSWAEEIFCDFFAIWLVGPCFSLAYIELLDISVKLYPSSAPSNAYRRNPLFTPSHPARLFRIKEHVRMLKTLGWWSEITDFRTHYVELLETAFNAPYSDFQFDTKDDKKANLAEPTLNAFALTTACILETVNKLMAGMDSGLEGFRRHHRPIEKYLSQGVVPSTVLVANRKLGRWSPGFGSKARPREEHPHFVSILNAAYKFYLESLPELVDNIEGQDSLNISHRNRWIKQLERWTMKAIDDSELWQGMEDKQNVDPFGKNDPRPPFAPR